MASEKMTEYERKRLENIRRNDQMMVVLKIHSAASQLSAASKRQRTAHVPSSKSYKVSPETQSPVVVRRSLRTRGMPPDSEGLDGDSVEPSSSKTAKIAMDRAHRLGQKKVVNVHRLIMRGTLEEKVTSLQKFKVLVANVVINAENASLKTMNTDQLVDLFASAETSTKGAIASKRSEVNFDGDPKLMGAGKGLKAILGGLEELWDQSQYTEEYNLSQFLAKLNG